LKSEKPKFFYGYIVVLAGFYIALATHGAFYSFGIFFERVLNEFGWTRAVTSGAFSLANLLNGLSSIIMGRLTDKLGPRIVITACGLLLGIGLLLMSQTSAIWQLYLFWGIIIAIGVSGGFVPTTSVVPRWFVERRGLMTGIVVAGIGAGTMIIPPLASQLISNYGWRTSSIVIGSIVSASVILVAQFMRRDPSQVKQLPYGMNKLEEKDLDLQATGFSPQEALHTKQFWMIFAIYLFYGACLQAIIVHVVIYATELGLSLASAANILAILGGLSIAAKVMMGNVADRVGNRLVLGTCLILMSIALLWLIKCREAWMFYLFAASFGFAYGGIVVVEALILAERFGLKSVGANLGICFLANTGGGAIGVVLLGGIFDMTSSYSLGFLSCALLSSAAFVLTLLLGQRDRKNSVSNI